MNTRGFTLIEILVVMAITTTSLVFVTYFALDISNFGTDLSDRLSAEFELQVTLRTILTEIRSMGPGDNGAYPIATATGSTFTFFSDIDNDGDFEQVRYYLDGSVLKKGVTNPSATEPVLYPAADEQISEVVHYLTSSTVFEYYTEGFIDEMTPLAAPIPVDNIRLVRISGTVDRDVDNPPLPTTLSITATIRNLRGDI